MSEPLRRSSKLLALTPCLALLAACPSPNDGCFVGDPSAPPELVIIHQTLDGTYAETAPGGAIPLILAPQGGRVLFVGAKAKNLDGCPVRLLASLRDPCSNSLLALEQRDVMMKATADGWLEPEDPAQISNYSNLPACPRAALERNVDGTEYRLRVELEDRAGRKAEAFVNVIPACNQPGLVDQCLCECSATYVLGEACTGDRPDSGLAPNECPRDGGT